MKTHVAIEIGKQYLKLVTVSLQGKQARLLDCHVELVSSLTDEQITKRLEDVARSKKLSPRSVTLSIARDYITVRNLHLPSQDPKEINDMIKLHITRVVPYKEEEILFSHRLLGTDEMGYSRVILAIAHIDMIRRQARILENAGWMADRIVLSSYGAWKSVLHNCQEQINDSELYVLLDIDSAYTDFIIFSRKDLIFTRSINIGASGSAIISDQVLTKLFGEVKQSLIMFYNEEQNKKPAKIFITGADGAVSHNKLLSDAAQATFDMPAHVVTHPARLDSLNQDTAKAPSDVSLSAILELSLQEDEDSFFFVLPEIQIKKILKEKTRDLVVLGSLSIYFFMLLCALFLGRIYHQQSYLSKLQRSSFAIEKDLGGLFGKVKKIGFIKNYQAARRLPLFIFQQLQKSVTAQVAVSYLNINDEYIVTLKGQAVQLSEVFKFMKNIEDSGVFNDLQTKYTRKRKLKDKEVTDFEINFKPIQ